MAADVGRAKRSTTADVVTFVDLNVLVYAHDARGEARQAIAMAELDSLWEGRDGVLSTQVLTEFYAVVTRKFDPPMPRREAREIVDSYDAWPVVQVDASLILAASQLEEDHKLSFWDAMIVEAAKRGGATRLLSEDLQDGRRFGELRVENPFN